MIQEVLAAVRMYLAYLAFDMDKEIERCLTESAVNFGTLLFLLAQAGIITEEEFQEAKVRIRAELDQQQAEQRDS